CYPAGETGKRTWRKRTFCIRTYAKTLSNQGEKSIKTPEKKPKKQELSPEQKIKNKQLVLNKKLKINSLNQSAYL
ncbi:hypothetical protein PN465_08635, partial [Nodularia spumigena CS-584]|nr:hypothetical protein [Nodularia spumigena CS-584]